MSEREELSYEQGATFPGAIRTTADRSRRPWRRLAQPPEGSPAVVLVVLGPDRAGASDVDETPFAVPRDIDELVETCEEPRAPELAAELAFARSEP